MSFNDLNELTSFSEPTFHVFNKKASSILDSPHFVMNQNGDRENLIILGDSMGDLHMSEGIRYNENSIIKIGFLNDRTERLPEYVDAFDVVILGDPHLQWVQELVQYICSE